jgi:energy-coupling factor transport system ATP-binding protein
MIQLTNVSYTYPFQERKALDSVTLRVEPGEAVLCTGRSGSGKSTLIRLLNGLAPHYFRGRLSGHVSVCGRDNANRSVPEIAEDVGTLFQDPEHQFFALNVEDELAFAHECRGVPPEEIRQRIARVVERFSLQHLTGSSVLTLSEGEKQKVALGSVISREPRVLILDEPTANLDPEATREMARILKGLKESGLTLFIVDHRLYWLEEIVDRVFLLEDGTLAETGDFSLLEDPSVRSRYGLRETRVQDPRLHLPPSDEIEGPCLDMMGICFAYPKRPPLFSSAEARLPLGRITAVIGHNGSGKTTLARILTGLERLKAGTLALQGRRMAPRKLLKRSSLVLQNTDHQLYMRTVKEELTASARHLPRGVREERAAGMLQAFRLQPLARRHPQSLSGGEKQRLVVACGAMKDPEIMILDEPSSGLDAASMQSVASLLESLADQGVCVLVISHDLELIQKVCSCRITLPLQGRVSPDVGETMRTQPKRDVQHALELDGVLRSIGGSSARR